MTLASIIITLTLAREPPSPEFMPLAVISADPPRRMMLWLCIAGVIVGSRSRIHRINSESIDCIHRLWTALSAFCARWWVWMEVFLREVNA
jgi:hypothetical protein